MLAERRLVEERSGGWVPVEAERPMLRYYAAAIAPLLAGAPRAEAAARALDSAGGRG